MDKGFPSINIVQTKLGNPDWEADLEKFYSGTNVEVLYKMFPNLEKIGTNGDYLEHLKSVFPESEVSDICWHGGSHFEGDFKPGKAGIYFTDNVKYAHEFIALNKNATVLVPAVLNIKNYLELNHIYFDVTAFILDVKHNYPNIDDSMYGQSQQMKDFIKQVLEDETIIQTIKECDGLKGKDIYDDSESKNTFAYGDSPKLFYKLKGLAENSNVYVAFESDQIYKLGTKQDEERFTRFMNEKVLPSPDLTE